MSSTTVRIRRHQAILELVHSRPIASQGDLARVLARRGHAVTQSTLSRDLKELRIVRAPASGGYRYLPAVENARVSGVAGMDGIAAAEVVAVEANEVAVIVRTQVGRAQGVAVYLDGLRLPGALATVAGDDTILVVPASIEQTRSLRRRLTELFGLS